jgi:sulfotransferase
VGIMQNQEMFFLAGLPRSGNTLLAAILNQNPEIYVSPISDLRDGLLNLERLNFSQNALRNKEVDQRNVKAINLYAKNYYGDVQKKYIFDRNKEWVEGVSLELIKKYITPDPKIIFTVRSISEILASLILIKKDIFLKQIKESKDLNMTNLEDENENVADFIIYYNEMFRSSFNSIDNCLNEKNYKNILLVEYDDIIKNPKKTMENIYNFLNIDLYRHDFNNINKLEIDNDVIAGDPKNMHDVRKKISKDTNPKSVFSKKAIERYDKMNIWR